MVFWHGQLWREKWSKTPVADGLWKMVRILSSVTFPGTLQLAQIVAQICGMLCWSVHHRLIWAVVDKWTHAKTCCVRNAIPKLITLGQVNFVGIILCLVRVPVPGWAWDLGLLGRISVQQVPLIPCLQRSKHSCQIYWSIMSMKRGLSPAWTATEPCWLTGKVSFSPIGPTHLISFKWC